MCLLNKYWFPQRLSSVLAQSSSLERKINSGLNNMKKKKKIEEKNVNNLIASRVKHAINTVYIYIYTERTAESRKTKA